MEIQFCAIIYKGEQLTSLKQHDLVILQEFHEARQHLGEFDDLLNGDCHSLGHFSPQLPMRLQNRNETSFST